MCRPSPRITFDGKAPETVLRAKTTNKKAFALIIAMDYAQAIALGILQGITEWLPVSSSGHLALLQGFFGISPPVMFDIMLHLGTLLSLVVYMRAELLQLARGLLTLDTNRPEFRLAAMAALACIPTAIIGLALRDAFASMFSSTLSVGAALMITSAVLFLSRNATGGRDVDTKSATIIGVVQGLAVAPGISRSGTTISMAMLLGVDRQKAARFSFLIFIPAILGATLIEARSADFALIEPGMVAAGISAAAISGYLSIGLLLRLLSGGGFGMFAYYCLILGSVAVAASLL